MSMKKKSRCITVIIIATFIVSCYGQERDLSLDIGDGEERCKSDKNEPCIFPFQFNNTFWGSKVWTDETGGKIYAGSGNSPGFNSYSSYDKKHSEPGSNSIAYCPDLSDIVCGIADCIDSDFRCKDNSSCIHASLVCDGFINCQDESDEDEKYFSSCPLKHGDSYPRKLESEKLANTFTCKQRYTGKNICAIPCDGRDDLCTGYEDEINCDDLTPGFVALGLLFLGLVLLGLFSGTPGDDPHAISQVLGSNKDFMY